MTLKVEANCMRGARGDSDPPSGELTRHHSVNMATGDLRRTVMVTKHCLEMRIRIKPDGIHCGYAGLERRVMHEDQHRTAAQIAQRSLEPRECCVAHCAMGLPFDQRIETQDGDIGQ